MSEIEQVKSTFDDTMCPIEHIVCGVEIFSLSCITLHPIMNGKKNEKRKCIILTFDGRYFKFPMSQPIIFTVKIGSLK